MAIIVFDDFNRPDDATSLGTAPTGHVWVPYNGDWTPGDLRWQILSNQAARECGGNPNVGGGGFALVESGFSDCIIRVTINNAAFGGTLNNNNFGITFGWVDSDHYNQAVWSRAGQFLRLCKVTGGIFNCTNEGFPGASQIQDGDVLEIHLCGGEVKGYFNGDLTVTTDFLGAGAHFGTVHGIQCSDGIIDDTAFALFDDFTIETNDACPSSPSLSASPSVSPTVSPSSSPSTSPEPRGDECLADNTKESIYIVDPQTGEPLLAGATLDGLYMIIAHQIFTYPFERKGFQVTPYLREPYVLDAQDYALGLSLLTKATRGQIVQAEVSGSPESGGQGKIT